MSKLLFNVKWAGSKPSIEEIRQKYGFAPDDIDLDYGVIEIDPQDNLYTILVEEAALERISDEYNTKTDREEGFFSNPRIEPFGLEEDKNPKND
jgi:hypothetical protein